MARRLAGNKLILICFIVVAILLISGQYLTRRVSGWTVFAFKASNTSSPQVKSSISTQQERSWDSSPRETDSYSISIEKGENTEPQERLHISSPQEKLTTSSSPEKLSISTPQERLNISSPQEKLSISSPQEKLSISSPQEKFTASSPQENLSISPQEKLSISSPREERRFTSSPQNSSKLGSSLPSPENPYAITVVTMYLNIGRFAKGSQSRHFSRKTYKDWLQPWAWMTNRVIAFFDDDDIMRDFRSFRSSQPGDQTVITKIQRKELPAFGHLDRIQTIFSRPDYPKHLPNTVYANYSCAMSAKYDVLDRAISMGLVKTKYVAWVDLGYFRNLLGTKLRPKDDLFSLEVPESFNASQVAFCEVTARAYLAKATPWEYIKSNHVWIAGGFVLGTPEVIRTFTKSYNTAWEELMRQNMSSTDQQVIGALYSNQMLGYRKVDIATYRCKDGQFGLHGSDVIYFCLGYICKEAAEKRTNRN